MEYVPDYPSPGEPIRLYIKIEHVGGTVRHCYNCVVSGYFIGNDGVKNYLFKNKTVGDEGIEFIYPGKPVVLIMKHGNKEYKFYVPRPSLEQSAKLVIYEHPFEFLLVSITGFVASILTIVAFISEKKTKTNDC